LNDARDTLEFFVLTPLPGSEDQKILFEKNVWMDPDMNKYELEHVMTAPAEMTKEESCGARTPSTSARSCRS